MQPSPAWAALAAHKSVAPSFIYEFGGWALYSNFELSDFPLSEVDSCDDESRPIIRLSKGEGRNTPGGLISPETFVWSDPIGTLSVYKLGDLYGLSLPELASFVVDPDAFEVVVYSDTDEATLSHLLLDQVLPRLMAYTGELIVHAGAVAVDGSGAIAFLGESGHGKSSLTASFVQNGAALLSDDAVRLEITPNEVWVSGLYPSLRLWPRSLEGLKVSETQTSGMAHYSSKRRISVPSKSGFAAPHRLRAVYQLNMGESDSDIAIEPISDREIMLALIEGTFRLDPTGEMHARRFFEVIDIFKSRIKGYRLSYPRGFENLPDVRAAIVSHLSESP